MKSKFDLWLEKVNETRKEYWDNNYSYKPYEPLRVEKGRKYIKLVDGNSVWGFVSMWEGINKGTPVKKGDLLKPQGYNAVAAHLVVTSSRVPMRGSTSDQNTLCN
jgi:hypothetical protein